MGIEPVRQGEVMAHLPTIATTPSWASAVSYHIITTVIIAATIQAR
jgi:hypothetical protein